MAHLKVIGTGVFGAQVASAAGHILDDTTLLGVTGTFGLWGIATHPIATGTPPNIVVLTAADWAIVKGQTKVTAATPEIFWATLGLSGRLSFLGLTALTSLDLEGDNLTEPPVLTGCTALTSLCLYNNQLTTPPDLSTNTALTSIALSSNQLTTPPDLTMNVALAYLAIDDNQLVSAGVDAILVALAAGTVNGGSVFLQQTPPAYPSETGLAARATLLAAPRSWETVSVDVA